MSVFAPASPDLPDDAGPLPGRTVRLQRVRVLFALVVREMATKFGRSAGGYLWAIAEPLGGILMLTLAFSIAFRTPPLGTNFALFYATGIIPFLLFSSISGGVAQAISSNRGLLTYPVVRPLDAVLAKFITNMLTFFIIGVLLYSSIILYYQIPVTLDLAAIFNGFLMMGLIGLGVGTMNCVLFGFFPTWRHIWSVLTKPLFILSGMFYTFESLPPLAQSWFWYNPLFHAVGLLRSGFYGGYEAAYVSPLYVLGFSGSLFMIGAYLLRRHAIALLEL